MKDNLVVQIGSGFCRYLSRSIFSDVRSDIGKSFTCRGRLPIQARIKVLSVSCCHTNDHLPLGVVKVSTGTNIFEAGLRWLSGTLIIISISVVYFPICHKVHGYRYLLIHLSLAQ